MPVTKSAKKKLRLDKKRKARTEKFTSLFRNLIRKAKRQPSEKTIKNAVSIVDKAVKKHVIHKNKAARLKSSFSKLLSKKAEKTPSKTKKKLAKKAPKK